MIRQDLRCDQCLGNQGIHVTHRIARVCWPSVALDSVVLDLVNLQGIAADDRETPGLIPLNTRNAAASRSRLAARDPPIRREMC
jgi:hypothetical protein